MKGLELNKAFFFEWGLPFIEREFPTLKEKLAAGCFTGSQALGADDHLSQDHGWGPLFTIFLDDSCEIPGEEIIDRMCGAAPKDFRGYGRRGGKDAAVELVRVNRFFEKIFGCIPKTNADWVRHPVRQEAIESGLYFLRHGALYFDGHGRFSELREKFSKYPSDVRLLRMAGSAYRIAHYGEYNFCDRLVERGDCISMQVALGYFAEAVMRMYFYLNDDFAPYWKWLAFEFRRRRLSPVAEKALETLHTLTPAEQGDQVRAVCVELKKRMIDRGEVPSDINNPHGNPWFFQAMGHLQDMISDENLK